jgi:hypothetical protein
MVRARVFPFAGANTHRFIDGGDEEFSAADPDCFGRIDDDCPYLLHRNCVRLPIVSHPAKQLRGAKYSGKLEKEIRTKAKVTS